MMSHMAGGNERCFSDLCGAGKGDGSILTGNGKAVAKAWSEPLVTVPLPASGGLCRCVLPTLDDAWCSTVLPAHCV